MQIERDIMRTLNSLGSTRNREDTKELLNELRGHVLALQAVRYFSQSETDEIMDKIEKAES